MMAPVTQKGACDPSYNFTVNVSDAKNGAAAQGSAQCTGYWIAQRN
jgi:hypothetical protein